MNLRAYYIEEEKLDGMWLVLDRPGGDVITTKASQAEASNWVEEHHPNAAIHLANGVGDDKWHKIK